MREADLGAALGTLDLPAAPPAAAASHDVDAISRALARLALLAPTAKERLVRAMLRLTFSDMRTTADEVELMRTFCAALGVPVPPALGMARA